MFSFLTTGFVVRKKGKKFAIELAIPVKSNNNCRVKMLRSILIAALVGMILLTGTGCKKDKNGDSEPLSIDSVLGTYKGKQKANLAGQAIEVDATVVVSKGTKENVLSIREMDETKSHEFEIKENKNGKIVFQGTTGALGLLKGEGHVTSSELYYKMEVMGIASEFRGKKQ
jgi:hypothetical protein